MSVEPHSVGGGGWISGACTGNAVAPAPDNALSSIGPLGIFLVLSDLGCLAGAPGSQVVSNDLGATSRIALTSARTRVRGAPR